MDDIVIIEDYMPIQEQIRIENIVLHEFFAWYYKKHANSYSEEHRKSLNLHLYPNAYDTHQFVHTIFHPTEGMTSDYFEHFAVLLRYFDWDKYVLRRMKINLTLNAPTKREEQFGIPHVDLIGLHDYLTAIYYATDSDGDTILFDKKVTEEKTADAEFWNLKEVMRIKPKRGKLVVFDGTRLHAGNWPSDDSPRIVFNINMQKTETYHD